MIKKYACLIIPFMCINVCFMQTAQAQNQVSLFDLLNSFQQNTPLTELKSIAENLNSTDIKTNNTMYLPQFAINGQAIYQSEVTSIDIPIPGIEIDPLSKDQYKIVAQMDQLIYDGGMIKKKNDMQRISDDINVLELEIQLEKSIEQIIEMYFKVLEIDAQKDILRLSIQNLEESEKMVESAIKYGTALKSEVNHVRSNLIQIEQQIITLEHLRSRMIKNLNTLCSFPMEEMTLFSMPPDIIEMTDDPGHKTVFKILEKQSNLLDLHHEVSLIALRPRVNAFVQGGYGRPGLNFLSNDFEPFFIAGLRFNWEFGSLYTRNHKASRNGLQQLKINRLTDLEWQKTNLDLNEHHSEINKIKALLASDREQLALHQEITQISEEQYQQGIISIVEYLRIKNQFLRVQQELALHEIQLTKASYLNQIANGNFESIIKQ